MNAHQRPVLLGRFRSYRDQLGVGGLYELDEALVAPDEGAELDDAIFRHCPDQLGGGVSALDYHGSWWQLGEHNGPL